jgi:hypothetical protein
VSSARHTRHRVWATWRAGSHRDISRAIAATGTQLLLVRRAKGGGWAGTREEPVSSRSPIGKLSLHAGQISGWLAEPRGAPENRVLLRTGTSFRFRWRAS